MISCELVEFDHLIMKPKLEEADSVENFVTPNSRQVTHAYGEGIMRNISPKEIIQLERRGFFYIDKAVVNPNESQVLHFIPDGKTKSMSPIETKERNNV